MTNDVPTRMKSAVAAVLVCLLIVVPSSLGMAFFVSPPVPPANRWITAARLIDIPESGVPRMITINVPRENVWQLVAGDTRTIYLLRSNAGITAFRSYFRHDLKLPVVYDADRDLFKTMCWNLEFTHDGNGLNRDAAQPMSMHRVETRVADGDILVRF